MTDQLEIVQENVADHMDGILRNFNPGRRIAVVVWTPEEPDADFLMMGGDPAEAIGVIQRRIDRGHEG